MIGPVDLLVDLRQDDGRPLRERLERELRDAVRCGRLAPSTALPSTRALAAQLGVSRGVIVEAYAQLVAEGYLSARQGAATVVAPRPRAGAGLTTPAAGGWPSPPPRFDFRYGTPDLSAFPRAAWQASSARAMRAASDAQLGYGDARGALELREVLAAYLGRVRGVVADPRLLHISGGTRQALGFVWRLLRDGGAKRVGIEDPGWSAQRDSSLGAGLEVVAIPVDEHGLQITDLAALDIDAVVLTPAHQCPTGALLAPERRAALLDWARARRAWIVEDDYDAEYRYDRQPVGALQGMDPDRVLYAGSVSKTLAPALRLGWIVLPSALAEAASRRQATVDRGQPVLTQLTLADLIARGELDRHLRRTRRRYRDRRDALVAAVTRELPGARIEGIAAGLHALVRLPAGCDERATVSAALERGIALEGLEDFARAPGSSSPGLVLGYGNLTEPAIARGIAELAGALRWIQD